MKPKILRKYKKTPPLNTRKEWMTLYFDKGISVDSIADTYQVPVSTVYYWLRKMDPKRKERSDKGKRKPSPTLELPDVTKLTLDGQSLEHSIEMMITSLFQAVTSNKKISAKDATYLTGQLVLQTKRLRSIQFQEMAKHLDLKIVQAIIRRYEPNASPLRMIEIFKEEAARVKMQKQNEFISVPVNG